MSRVISVSVCVKCTRRNSNKKKEERGREDTYTNDTPILDVLVHALLVGRLRDGCRDRGAVLFLQANDGGMRAAEAIESVEDFSGHFCFVFGCFYEV